MLVLKLNTKTGRAFKLFYERNIMYFQKIETDRAHNKAFNNSLKAAAARRLGDLQRNDTPSAKRAAMLWNEKQHVANGAKKGTANRKMAQRLEWRLASWSAGNGKSKADHKHHRPGSYTK